MDQPPYRIKPDPDIYIGLGPNKVFFDLGEFTESGYPKNYRHTVGQFKTMMFIADTDLSATEIDHLASLIGYYWKIIVKGPALTGIERIATNAFIVKTDFSQSRSTTPSQRFGQFVYGLNKFLMEGSPVRAGKGRLVEPFGRKIDLSVRVDEMKHGLRPEPMVVVYSDDDKPPAPMPATPPRDSKPPAPMPAGSRKRIFKSNGLDASTNLMALEAAKDLLPQGEQDILELAMEVVRQNIEMAQKLRKAEATLEAITTVINR